LNLVGVSRSELGSAAVERTDYHPYLTKGSAQELSRYLDLLRSATLFVMPMRQGPFPGVIREALLLYTPVIVSNIWNEELKVNHDYNGILVDRIEPETFAEEMHALLQARDRWERLARNAHESVQKFSWDRAAQELIEVMTNCAAQTHTNRE
jgi:glycosyltransferase involved in cell wall biosynthesis